MSQKTGVISCHWSACAVAMKVNEGTMTSPLRPAALIADAYQIGDPPLELLHVRAAVAQPLSVEHIFDAVKQPLLAVDVGAAHVELFAERRQATEYCQIINGELHWPSLYTYLARTALADRK
jgi:hypothetical protein